MNRLELVLTDKCNFNCTYCFENDYRDSLIKKEDMSFEIAKLAIDNELEMSKRNKKLRIIFFGGEPLIKFTLIREICKYVEERYPKYDVNYSISTNGSLLTERVKDFLIEKNISTLVSIDGIKEAHDANRLTHDNKGTFDLVMRNEKNYLELNRHDLLLTRVTVAQNNFKYLLTSLKWLFEIGHIKIAFDIDRFERWDEKNYDELDEVINEVSDWYYSIISRNKKKIFTITNFDSIVDKIIYPHKPIGCGIGKTVKSVSPIGDYYGCSVLLGVKKEGNVFLNNIKPIDFDPNLLECKDCELFEYCSHCIGHNYVTQGDYKKTSYQACRINQIMLKNCKKFADNLYANEVEIFYKYYKNHKQNHIAIEV